MREGGCRRGVGQVVRRNVHGLNGGDRARLGRGDAFLQHAHFFGQRRLVTHRRGHAAEQRGHFRARQRVTIDIVDEEQHVAALAGGLFFVAEIFRHGQTGERDAQTVARRFVHLAVHHGHLGVRQVVFVDDARFDHLVIEVVAFASTLADAREHGQAAVLLGDVVDELEHVDGLAHAGAAEQADLAALGERHQQIDDLDARDQKILAAGLLVVGRGGAVNGQVFRGLHRTFLVLRLAEHVHDAAERARAHRHGNPLARAVDGEAAAQAFGRTHRDRAHDAVAELLLHFERQVNVIELERVVDLGDLIARKFHVDDRADDLHDFAAGH